MECAASRPGFRRFEPAGELVFLAPGPVAQGIVEAGQFRVLLQHGLDRVQLDMRIPDGGGGAELPLQCPPGRVKPVRRNRRTQQFQAGEEPAAGETQFMHGGAGTTPAATLGRLAVPPTECRRGTQEVPRDGVRRPARRRVRGLAGSVKWHGVRGGVAEFRPLPPAWLRIRWHRLGGFRPPDGAQAPGHRKICGVPGKSRAAVRAGICDDDRS